MKDSKKTLLWLLFISQAFSFFGQKQVVLEGYAQGTTYHIQYIDQKGKNYQKKINQLLINFDKSVSTYQLNSIISKVNNNQKVKLDSYFTTCFVKAQEIYKNSSGAFDPTVAPLVNAWGFGPQKKQEISSHLIDSLLQFVGFDLIELKDNKIIKKDSRIALDFNAFAQGYSVDVVADFLRKKGLSSFLVEIGGEVYAQGKQLNDENWIIGIEEPIDNQTSGNPYKAILRLDGKAIATSGNYRRYFIENGVKYVHHIDPKTGYPTKNNLLSASVISTSCLESDATATALLVMGLEKAIEYVNNRKDLEAYLIYTDEKGNYKSFITLGFAYLIIEEN